MVGWPPPATLLVLDYRVAMWHPVVPFCLEFVPEDVVGLIS